MDVSCTRFLPWTYPSGNRRRKLGRRCSESVSSAVGDEYLGKTVGVDKNLKTLILFGIGRIAGSFITWADDFEY